MELKIAKRDDRFSDCGLNHPLLRIVQPSSMYSFKRIIKELGGVWTDKENVYFAHTRDTFEAAYQPRYPEKSPEDSVISYDWTKKVWSENGPHAENVEIEVGIR